MTHDATDKSYIDMEGGPQGQEAGEKSGSLIPAKVYEAQQKALSQYVPQEQAMTPAQARVDAVANVLHKAYERASTLELTPEQVTRLKADFPDEAFKLGAGGNPDLLYIEHAYLRDRFDEVIGMGQWALVRTKPHWGEDYTTAKGQKATRIYADCALLIKGCLVSEAIGEMSYFHNNASQTYGDAAEGSETAAFRRCAKKLGVGLQAWKKDYCEGWMKRHKGGFRPAQAPQAPSRPAPATAPPTKPADTAPRVPTLATKAWFLKQLPDAAKEMATNYFIEVGALLPTEALSDLPLANVPTSKDELKAVLGAIEHFGETGEAAAAFPPHRDAPIIPPKETEKPIEVPRDKPGADAPDEWFMKIVVPVPHKGQKRDEYLKSPDTIGSLYEARHQDDSARNRLFGFAYNYEAKGWTKNTGQQMPPSAADIKFREALDAFLEWFKANHPDEVKE